VTCQRVFYLPAIMDGELVTIRVPAKAVARKSMPKDSVDNVVTITNTALLSGSDKLALAATPGAIIEQERFGQEELVAGNQLPRNGLLGADRTRWEALGLKILDEGGDDPLFCRVELPPGWRKVPREHALWTDLVDETGKVRAEIRYKAAFYDRYAGIQLKDPQPGDDVACVCAECGHEQIGMQPCRKCGSLRTVALSVVVREFGENWRETCFPTEDTPTKAP
jgi:hypothetical protein